MNIRQSMSLAFLVSVSIVTNPLHASFAQRKNGITLRVRDLSTQQDRKLIGTEIGAREMRELNRFGIFPVLIELKNRSEESFVFGPQTLSVPIYSPLEMACKVPTISGKSFLAIVGGFLSLYGGIATGFVTWLNSNRPFIDALKNDNAVRIGSASTLALFYLGIKGLLYGCKKELDRKQDQAAWLNEWMLKPGAIILKPNSAVKKFIFLDKKTYQGGCFKLTLNALYGQNMSFDVSLLP